MPKLKYLAIVPFCFSTLFADTGEYTTEELQTVYHLPPPLRADALTFSREWLPLAPNLEDNYFATYINTTINQDGIGKRLAAGEGLPSYDPVHFEVGPHLNEEIKIFRNTAAETFHSLEQKNNAFALYFQGVFTYHDHPINAAASEKEEATSNKILAQQLLNQASEKNYVTATKFMIDKQLWEEASMGQRAFSFAEHLRN